MITEPLRNDNGTITLWKRNRYVMIMEPLRNDNVTITWWFWHYVIFIFIQFKDFKYLIILVIIYSPILQMFRIETRTKSKSRKLKPEIMNRKWKEFSIDQPEYVFLIIQNLQYWLLIKIIIKFRLVRDGLGPGPDSRDPGYGSRRPRRIFRTYRTISTLGEVASNFILSVRNE